MGFFGGLCKCCGETLIVILNTFTILVGLLMTACGVLFTLYWELPSVGQYLTDLLQQHVDPNFPNLTESYSEVAPGMIIIGYVISGIGLLLVVGGLLGCCSAMCHSSCLMSTYGVFLGILSVALLTTTIVIALDHQIVLLPVEQWLFERVQSEFTDPLNNQTSPVGFSATAIMFDLQCCGVRNYTEFQTCELWNKQYSYNGLTINAVVPSACCKNLESWNTTAQYESNCLNHPDSFNSYISTPCFPLISEYLVIGILWSLAILGVIGGLLSLLFVYTIILVCIYTNRRVKKEYKDAAHRFQHFIYPNAAFTGVKTF